jgi:hypothetical protein
MSLRELNLEVRKTRLGRNDARQGRNLILRLGLAPELASLALSASNGQCLLRFVVAKALFPST